jgi:hypothetical protein
MRFDFVILPFMSDAEVSATAHILAPTPAQMFVKFFEAKQNSSTILLIPQLSVPTLMSDGKSVQLMTIELPIRDELIH